MRPDPATGRAPVPGPPGSHGRPVYHNPRHVTTAPAEEVGFVLHDTHQSAGDNAFSALPGTGEDISHLPPALRWYPEGDERDFHFR